MYMDGELPGGAQIRRPTTPVGDGVENTGAHDEGGVVEDNALSAGLAGKTPACVG